MIDGLKLTLSGEELRTLLEQRIANHRRGVERWKQELERTPEDATDDNPLLPDDMCENEAERHEWRIEVLEFVRDHIDLSEVYRLAEADLRFGELLPDKPGWLKQEEYEERTAVGFYMGRLVKQIDGLTPCEYARVERLASQRHSDRDTESSNESGDDSSAAIRVETDIESTEAISPG